MATFEKIPDLQKIFDKHNISDDAQKELENAFEKLIVRAFYKELSVKGKAPPKASTAKASTAKATGICIGTFYPGTAKEKPCTFKAVAGEYCKRHDPNKKTATKKTTKKHEHECNAIIKKTQKQCQWAGTVKPDGAEFHYCKRHSTKWAEFEESAKTDEEGEIME